MHVRMHLCDRQADICLLATSACSSQQVGSRQMQAEHTWNCGCCIAISPTNDLAWRRHSQRAEVVSTCLQGMIKVLAHPKRAGNGGLMRLYLDCQRLKQATDAACMQMQQKQVSIIMTAAHHKARSPMPATGVVLLTLLLTAPKIARTVPAC